MKDKYILFDFDGVIIDSYDCAFEVSRSIHPRITDSQYRKCFDGNINEDKDKGDIVHDEFCRHDLDFSAAYSPLIEEKAPIIPGMTKVVKELAGSYKMIIISSTLTAPINDILAKFGLSSFFIEAMGNDVNPSKVEKIKMAFAKYGMDPEQCVFITDTVGDMREAAKTGVGAIGVSWGFQRTKDLLRGKPFRIVDKPEELPAAISEYFS